jgi:hypothetical protein
MRSLQRPQNTSTAILCLKATPFYFVTSKNHDTCSLLLRSFLPKTLTAQTLKWSKDVTTGMGQLLSRIVSSGMLHRVALVRADVSEELRASIIRVTRIGELGTTLA